MLVELLFMQRISKRVEAQLLVSNHKQQSRSRSRYHQFHRTAVIAFRIQHRENTLKHTECNQNAFETCQNPKCKLEVGSSVPSSDPGRCFIPASLISMDNSAYMAEQMACAATRAHQEPIVMLLMLWHQDRRVEIPHLY
ncbi:hypothetical protein MRB53_038879 [Persea americana]|nr:hypothetical protein MRB53_038879 [Persea americana]